MPKDTNQDGVIPSMFQYYKCRLDGASVSVVRKRSDFKMSDSRFKINRLFVEENMKSWTRKLETE